MMIVSMMDDFESVSHPFQNLLTDYKQKKFFQNSAAFIPAEQLPLGIGYYPQNNTVT